MQVSRNNPAHVSRNKAGLFPETDVSGFRKLAILPGLCRRLRSVCFYAKFTQCLRAVKTRCAVCLDLSSQAVPAQLTREHDQQQGAKWCHCNHENGYALFVDERASAARCRFSIMATYLTSRSIDMALRHALKAATPVVPPPAKLSSTMSPSLEKISTSLRVSSSGFSVGCSVRL